MKLERVMLWRLGALALVGCVAASAAGRTMFQRLPESGPFHANLLESARRNVDFRRVLSTGERSQIVVMSLVPGEAIGQEQHRRIEQTIVIVTGQAKAVVDGHEVPLGPGEVVVMAPGAVHDVVNVGSEPLKLYTVYTPPSHLDGRVHPTKEDAARDVDDEAFGQRSE